MSIQLFKPMFRVEECLCEIKDCLEKGWTGLGYKTVEFEERWKDYTGLKNAHFLNSATAGLELAIKILKMENNWDDGDEIITTPITFVSTNHAILYANLKPVFADIDKYLCLDPIDVKKKITNKTKAIIFVGIGGNTGQYNEIIKLSREYNLKIILDAAHMSGTRLAGEHVGKDTDAAVFSFQAVKNLPTADSGMVCFKDNKNDEICRKLSWLGINKDTYSRTLSKGNYKWKYDVEYLGYKYHGNSVMAAIGLVQLRYLDQDNAYRRQLAKWYDEALNECNKIKPIPVSPECESSRHLYIIEVNNRDDLMKALNEKEIYPGSHYHDNTCYTMYKNAFGTCPNAHSISDRVLSLPMHLFLTKVDIDYMVSVISEYAN